MNIQIVDNLNHLYRDNSLEIDVYDQSISKYSGPITTRRAKYFKRNRIVKLKLTLEPFYERNYIQLIKEDLRHSGLSIHSGKAEIKLKSCRLLDKDNQSCFIYEAFFEEKQ